MSYLDVALIILLIMLSLHFFYPERKWWVIPAYINVLFWRAIYLVGYYDIS